MYADRHTQERRFHPTGLAAAIAINVGFVAALMFSVPTLITEHAEDKPLKTYSVPVDPPPPPEMLEHPALRATRPSPKITAPDPIVPTHSSTDYVAAVDLTPPPPLAIDPRPAVIVDTVPPPPLVLTEPSLDQRYARDFQPIYPAAERRAGREGRVTVRVLVGVDGRVKEAQRVNATSDDFWQVTLNRALSKWRFKPATRGGVPVEAWRTLSLTFVLEG